MRPPQEQIEILCRGVVDLHVRAELEQRLASGKPLRIKAGFDPTRPDLHLGHTVLMQKMRQFQELGHTVIFVVGDFTAMVGDPTGQNDQRPRLTRPRPRWSPTEARCSRRRRSSRCSSPGTRRAWSTRSRISKPY